MRWTGALIWAACCAGAAAAALKIWVLPHREVSKALRTALLCAAAAGGALGGWMAAGDTAPAHQVRVLAALACVGAGALVDLFRRRIPNVCSLLLLASAAVCTALDFLLARETAVGLLISGLLGGLGLLAVLSLCRLISRGGIGLGDITLVSALGLVLGLYGGLATLLYAQVAAVLAAVVLLAAKRAGWKDAMPFAPFLWVGLLVCLVLGTY